MAGENEQVDLPEDGKRSSSLRSDAFRIEIKPAAVDSGSSMGSDRK